ncbi:hypothetical protein [Streptomyces sp. NPDC047046]
MRPILPIPLGYLHLPTGPAGSPVPAATSPALTHPEQEPTR